jgi:citrate synthase
VNDSVEPEKATLHFPGGSAEFPIIRGTDGHDSIDISTFMPKASEPAKVSGPPTPAG